MSTENPIWSTFRIKSPLSGEMVGFLACRCGSGVYVIDDRGNAYGAWQDVESFSKNWRLLGTKKGIPVTVLCKVREVGVYTLPFEGVETLEIP